MSKEKTVDTKALQMVFDGKQFEQGVKGTMSLLDKFKKSFDFSGMEKGLTGINKASNKVDMSALSKSAEAVQVSFSAMSVISMTAISNITTAAMRAGTKIAKALTIEPVFTGFSEYETQINAVQTILANTASKGTTIDDVNIALDELNTYSDKTIYNFTEMARNIGTFTAAGIDLDTSVSAIQGIANLAAISGSTSQQAATAMYQLSQALSAGKIQLMDWNSVVNAGMGGEVFRTALMKTARDSGIAIDSIIKKAGSFRESISNGWLSAEVLTTTLKSFTTSGINEYIAANSDLTVDAIALIRSEADSYEDAAKQIALKSSLQEADLKDMIALSQMAEDAATKVKTFTQLKDTIKESVQSGWTQTWELIIGDFEQAKTVFTEINDLIGAVIAKSAESRNSFLSDLLGPKTVSTEDWDNLDLVYSKSTMFQKALLETARAEGIAVDEMMTQHGSFQRTLIEGWLNADILTKTLKQHQGNMNESSKAATSSLEQYQKLAKEIIDGNWGNGADRMQKLTEAGYDYASAQSIVNNILLGTEVDISNLSDAQLKNAGYTDLQVESLRELAKVAEETGTPLNQLIEDLTKPTGRDLLLGSVMNILKTVVAYLNIVKTAWNEVFSLDTDDVYEVLEGFNKFTESLIPTETETKSMVNILKALFSIMKVGIRVILGLVKIGATLLNFVLKPVKDVFITIGGLLGNVTDASISLGEFGIGAITDGISNLLEMASGLPIIGDIINGISDGVTFLGDCWHYMISQAANFNPGSLEDNLKSLGEYGQQAFASMQSGFEKFIKTIRKNDTASNILDAIAAPFKIIQNGIKGLKLPTLDTFVTEYGKLQTYLKNSGQDSNAVKVVVGSLKYLWDLIYKKSRPFSDTIFGKALDWVKTVIKKIGEALSSFGTLTVHAEEITKPFTQVTTAISDTVTPLEATPDKMETIKNIIKNVVEKMGEIVGAVKDALTKFTGPFDVSNILSITDAVMKILVLFQLSKALKSISGVGKSVSGTFQAITGRIENKESKTKAIRNFAISVAIISASMWLLAQIPVEDALRASLMVLGIVTTLVLVFGALSIISKKFDSGIKTAGAVGAMIGLSIGILAFATALKKLQGIKWEECKVAMGLMVVFLFELAVAAAALGAIGGKIGSSSLTILALVFALNAMIGVLRKYQKLEPEVLEEGGKKLVIVAAGIAAFLMAVSAASKGSSVIGAAVVMLVLTHTLKKMYDIILLYAELNIKSIMPTLILLAGVMIFLGIIVRELCSSARDAKKAIAAAVVMLAFAFALKTLCSVLNFIGNVDLGVLIQGMVTIGILLAGLTTAIKSVSGSEMKKSVAGLIVLVLAVTMLSGLAILLGLIPISIALRGAITIGILLLSIGGSLRLANGVSKETIVGIVAITGAVTLLAYVITILSTLPIANVLASAAALVGLMLAITGSLVIASKFASKGSTEAMMGIIVMAGCITLLGFVIKMLSELPIKNVLASAAALAGLMLALSVSLAIASKLGGIEGAVSLLLVSLAVIAIAGALTMLAAVPITQIMAAAVAIAAILASLVLASVIMGSVSVGAAVLVAVLLGFAAAAMIVGVAAVLLGSGLILIGDALPNVADGLLKLGPALATSSKAMGVAIAAIVLGVASTIPTIIKYIGKGIVEFVKVIGNSAVAVGEAFLKILEAIVDVITTSIPMVVTAFLKMIIELLTAVRDNAPTIMEIGFDIVILIMKGLIKKVPEFVDTAVSLIITFVNAVGKKAGDLVQAGIDLMLNFINGLANGIRDNQDKILAAVSNVLSAIIEFALSALQAVLGKIPFVGEKISKGLESAKDAVRESLAPEAYAAYGANAMIATGDGFYSQTDYITNSIRGTMDGAAGTMAQYPPLFNPIGVGMADQMIMGMSSRQTFMNDAGGTLANSGMDGFNNAVAAGDFKGTLAASMATGFAKSESTVSGSVSTLATTATAGFNSIDTSGIAYKKVTDFTSGFNLQNPAAFKASKNVSTSAGSGLSSVDTSKIGSNAGMSFVNSVSGTSIKAFGSGSAVGNSGAAGATSAISSFTSAGGYSGDGFVNGILSKTGASKSAGSTLGMAAYEGTKAALAIQSPSRKFGELGSYSGIGYTNKLVECVSSAYDAGKSLGDSAKEGLKDAVIKLSSYIDADMNLQPTIRPVLDLSDISNKSTKLDTMFSALKALSVDATIRSKDAIKDQNGNTSTVTTIEHKYTQNIYSPKAVSRTEIYRQTNNQLKGAFA